MRWPYPPPGPRAALMQPFRYSGKFGPRPGPHLRHPGTHFRAKNYSTSYPRWPEPETMSRTTSKTGLGPLVHETSVGPALAKL